MNADNKKRLDALKKRRDMYLEAEEAVLSGQEYRNGTFSLRRADLKDIQATIQKLDGEIAQLEGRRRYAFRIVLRD